MSGRYPPLTCVDEKRILRALGFTVRPGRGTSHEQWIKARSDGRRVLPLSGPTIGKPRAVAP